MSHLALIPYPHLVEHREGQFVWPARSEFQPRHLVGMVQTMERLTLDAERHIEWGHASLGKEGYRLLVERNFIRIESADEAGRRHAARTLVQLWDGQSIPCVEIKDGPRFGWRGMMLDPSRHFVPKSFVLKFLDLMAQFKFNSLHLHLCDDQGWRMEIKKYPRLTEVGAWRKATPWRPGSDDHDGQPHGGFYTQDDLREIVAYAAERGINVLPEIEMPGHCQAALAAYPELGNTGKQLEPAIRFGVIEDVYGVQDATLRFLEDVLTEVLEIFPSPFIHVGGDEVPKTQWRESAVAQQRIREEGLADEDELQSWFIRHFDRWLSERGRRLVGWDEILEGGLASGATVMSWRGFAGGIAAAKQGHDVIMAPTGHCYFDHYQSQIKSKEPTAIGGFLPLEKVYAFEPVPPELSAEEAKHVLGGQGQLWSEYLRTTDQVEYMALPRMLALAEALWGKPQVEGDAFSFFRDRLEPRLLDLERQGYRFRPLQPLLPAGYRRIGGWALEEVGADGKELEILVEDPPEGSFEIAVHYSGGAYGVWVDEIEACGADRADRVDLNGSTGNFDERNVARFEPRLGPLTVRVKIRSKGTGGLERNNQGDVYLVSAT